MRTDLDIKYLKYISANMKFPEKGANMMTDKEWLEQPPIELRHKELIGV